MVLACRPCSDASALLTGGSLAFLLYDPFSLLIWGAAMNAPGTAPMVGFAALMHRIPPGRAVGGSGALTESLLNRLDADGAQVLTGAPATSISRCSDESGRTPFT